MNVPDLFDKKQILRNRQNCRKRFSRHSFLCEKVGEELADRLLDIKRRFVTGLFFGTGRMKASVLQGISKNAGLETLVTADLSDGQIHAREEEIPFGRNTLDFVGSHLSLHTANDLPGALIQINYALKPDGLFLGAMFGGETLYELRQVFMKTEMELKGGISPRVMPFADKQQMGALLQRAGFALPVVDSDIIEVSYSDLYGLLYDVKGMGESNVVMQRPRTCPGKGFFERADSLYRADFAESSGRLKATFEIIYLIGWAPHDSQQKPLRPGSAKNSLAQALGSRETKLE